MDEDEAKLRDSIMESLEKEEGEKGDNIAAIIMDDEEPSEKPDKDDSVVFHSANEEDPGGKEDDHEVVEMEAPCFTCGELNCEDKSHTHAKNDCDANLADKGGNNAGKSTDKEAAPPAKKLKTGGQESCCDDMDCTTPAKDASKDTTSAGKEGANAKTPPDTVQQQDPKSTLVEDDSGGGKAPPGTAQQEDPKSALVEDDSGGACCGTKRCTCGKLDCEDETHVKLDAASIPAATGKDPASKTKTTSASCCEAMDCTADASKDNAPSGVATSNTTPEASQKKDPKNAPMEEDSGGNDNCCGTQRCACGKLDCDDETHVKLDAASIPIPNSRASDTDTSQSRSVKKQPYKVKMNIHQRWNNLFDKLKAFHQEHNSWSIPRSHPDKALERWVNRQRSTYHRGQLKPKRRAALDAIGFEWGQPPKHKGDTWITTKPWHERFEQLMEFKEWHGHCKVPTKYEEDPSLNRWVWKQQRDYQQGKLTKEQIKCLKSLGVPWIPKEKTAKKRKRDSEEEGGDEHSDDDGDDDEKSDEEEAGAVVVPVIKSSWDMQFDDLVKFKAECGHTNVTTKHDHKLGTWAQRQRTHMRQKNLHPERIKKLNEIGFQWRAAHANFVPRTWKDQYYMLKKFKEENKHVNVPPDYPADKLLARWVQHQRRDKKIGSLSQDRIDWLNELAFDWDGPGAEVANVYTEKNQPIAPAIAAADTPMNTQQQLLLAQQKALARQYEDLTQQQAIATQQQAFFQQKDAYASMTAHQQLAFAQQQRQLQAGGPPGMSEASMQAEARRAVEWMKQQQAYMASQYAAAATQWPPAGWGWNTRGELVYCGAAATGTPPAAAGMATTPVAPAAATALSTAAATPTTTTQTPPDGTIAAAAVAAPSQTPTVPGTAPAAETARATPMPPGLATVAEAAAAATPAVTTTPAAAETLTATTEGGTADAPAAPTATNTTERTAESAQIQQLTLENAKLKEENLKLSQDKLQLLRENTGLQNTLEETRQAYLKEKKTLQDEVQDHSSQLEQQANQTKSQGDQMQQLMKQVMEMKQLQEKQMQQTQQNSDEKKD